MVEQTLQTQKPDDAFTAKITRAIALQRQGRLSESVQAHQQALDAIVALQRQGRHAQAVRLHRKALRALSKAGLSALTWADTYTQLAPSYYAAGKALDLAEGILSVIPEKPDKDTVFRTVPHLFAGADAFGKAGKPERAIELLGRVVDLTEGARARAASRFWRGEALMRMRAVASERGDEPQAARHLKDIGANLQAIEKDLNRVARGQKTSPKAMAEVDDRDDEDWFKWAGHAYHNAAVAVYMRLGNTREALRLLKRANELRPFAFTHALLARLILGTTGDKVQSRAHLAKAMVDPRFRENVRKDFHEADEFKPVRADPAFLAIVRPSKGDQ